MNDDAIELVLSHPLFNDWYKGYEGDEDSNGSIRYHNEAEQLDWEVIFWKDGTISFSDINIQDDDGGIITFNINMLFVLCAASIGMKNGDCSILFEFVNSEIEKIKKFIQKGDTNA